MWVDGRARVACVTPVRRVTGRQVTTPRGSAGGVAPALGCRVLRPPRGQPVRFLHTWHRAAAGRASKGRIGDAPSRRCRSSLRASTCAGARAGSRSSTQPAAPLGVARCLEVFHRAILGTPVLAAWRAQVEGPAFQSSSPDVVLGGGGFADDSAPRGALVQLGAGGALAPGLRAARAGSGRVQGRNSTVPLSHPLPRCRPGEWALTLQTSWLEPAYVEPDASWARPGDTPSFPLGERGRASAASVASGPGRAAMTPGGSPTPAVRPSACCGAARTWCVAGPSAHLWRSRSVPTGPASSASAGPSAPAGLAPLVDAPAGSVLPGRGGRAGRRRRTAGVARPTWRRLGPKVLAARAVLDAPAALERTAGRGDVHASTFPGAGTARVELHVDDTSREMAGGRGRRVGGRRPLSRDSALVLPSARCTSGTGHGCGAEGIALDTAGEPVDLTIRSFGILTAPVTCRRSRSSSTMRTAGPVERI